MANQDAPFGLRPVRTSISSQQQNRYRVANNYGTAIFQGDLVALDPNGTITRVAAGGTGLILGVFNGCEYTDPTTGKATFTNSYPGLVAADDIMANVIDDPNATFEVQSDGTFAAADIGGNFDILATAGDTTSGISREELDQSTIAATATLPLKAIDVSQDPENSDTASANGNVIVKINNHIFSGGTAGVTT